MSTDETFDIEFTDKELAHLRSKGRFLLELGEGTEWAFPVWCELKKDENGAEFLDLSSVDGEQDG